MYLSDQFSGYGEYIQLFWKDPNPTAFLKLALPGLKIYNRVLYYNSTKVGLLIKHPHILPISLVLSHSNYAFPNDTRIPDSQTFAKFLVYRKMKSQQFKEVRKFLWIEFLDYIVWKYNREVVDEFLEKLKLIYG